MNLQLTLLNLVLIPFSLLAGKASFSYENHCINNLIYFQDQSEANEEIVSWYWDFGDESISTDQFPVHAFAESGTYNVNLTIKTINGKEYSNRQTIKINAAPFAFFNPKTNCDQIVDFNDNSFTTSKDVKMWIWDFGDGNYSTEQNPQHRFNEGDQKNVHFKVLDKNGCWDSITQRVNVIKNPKTGFDINDVILSNPAIIRINSHNNKDSVFYLINNQIVSGETGFMAIPSDQENEIKQKAINKEGCVDSTSIIISPQSDYQIPLPGQFNPVRDVTFGIKNKNIKVNRMRVFDTNGKKVYASNSQPSWNGKTATGANANNGIYIYALDYINQDGINITQKGKFILKN